MTYSLSEVRDSTSHMHPVATALLWLAATCENQEVVTTFTDFVDGSDVPTDRIDRVRWWLYAQMTDNDEERFNIDELVRFMDSYVDTFHKG